MKNKLFAVFIVLFMVISFTSTSHAEAPVPDKPAPVIKTEWSVTEVQALVDIYADKYGVSRQFLNKVVKCESSYNYKAVNMKDSHKLSKGSHGVAQFSRETFLGAAKQMGKDYDDPYNPDQALDVMAWMFSKGQQNHWTCAKK